MKVKNEYIVCDVCREKRYSVGATAEVMFTHNGNNYSFDCCYRCLCGGTIRKVYRKIVKILKAN